MSTADPTSAPKDSTTAQDDAQPPSVAQAAPAVSLDQSNKTTASAPIAATRTEGPGTGENTAEDKGETEETVGGEESKIDKRSTEDKPPSLTASLEKKTGNGKPLKAKLVSPKRAKEENVEKDDADKKQKPPKQKKKRRTLWVILHSCFAPPKTHAVQDEEVTLKTSTPKPKSGAQASKPSHTAEPSATSTVAPAQSTAPQAPAALRIESSRPHTPAQHEGDVIVPPTPGTAHLLPTSETGGVTSGAVQAPGSIGNEHDESEHSTISDEEPSKPYAEEDEEERLIMNGGNGIPIGPDGLPAPLLPPLHAAHNGRKCLVLDLDETLVHSSFKLIPQADYVVPVEIEWQWHNVYVIKRPGVDSFLKRMGELYEVVVFTASLSKYADPVLDKLDVHKVVAHRLFRESCYLHKGNYVKDLSQLGRPLNECIILDNSPASYIFHPNNAVPVSSWFNDPHDTELTDMTPFLADLVEVADIRGVLDGGL